MVVWWPVGIVLFTGSVAVGLMIALSESLRFLPVLICFTIFISSITWLVTSVKRAASDYTVTNKRVLVKQGALTIRNVEIFLSKIESIEVQQDIIGCMIGFGTVIICGTGGTKQQFMQIDNPLEFRRHCQEQIDGMRSISYSLN